MATDIVFNTGGLPDAYVGEAYYYKFVSHGAATVLSASSISVGALPAGLTLGSTAGNYDVVTGTPTAPGAYTFTISLTDSPDTAVTKACTINVWGTDQQGMHETENPAADPGITEQALVQNEWPVVQ